MKKIIKQGVQYLIDTETRFLSTTDKHRRHLCYCPDYRCLYTRRLTINGDRLIFNFDYLALEWKSDTGVHEFLELKEYKSDEITQWIIRMAQKARIEQEYYRGEVHELFSVKKNIHTKPLHINNFARSKAIQLEIEEAFTDLNAVWW